MKLNISKKEGENREKSSFISFEKLLETISNDDPDKLISIFLEHLKEHHNLGVKEVIAKIGKSTSSDSMLIPVEIFAANLSPAEALVKYLREEFDLGYNEIASLINRDERGIWGTYRRAKQKMDEPFTIKEAKFFIPISIFKDRKLSILENAVKYLIETYDLTTYKIAKILNKKPSTLWSVSNRVKTKNE